MACIEVQARPGIVVPMERDPRLRIGSDAPVRVEDSPYYRRRLADGDLLPVDAPRKS